VTFKCLPEEGTTPLKIQQIKVSDLKLPEDTNPYGEYAYDITTDMQNGTFEYDVTLPKPEDQDVDVSYMENLDSEVKTIEDEKINQEGDKVKAESLDHFTIFIPVERTDVLKIMPLGDSITKGSGGGCYSPYTYLNCTGYRDHLWNMLVENGFDEFDFVGSQGGIFQYQYTHDNDHEGHGGWTPGGIEGNVYGWLETYQPDIILLHIGTNDLNSGDVEDILDKIDDYETAESVEIDVILALIINQKDGGHTATSNFNNAVETMALARITAEDNLKIVDMENGAGINYVTDMEDSKHPNNSGYQKMAAAWYNALTNETVDPSCPTGVQPISGATVDDSAAGTPTMLQSVTVGASCYTIGVNNLYTGTGSGTQGDAKYPIVNADNFDINSFANANPHKIEYFGGNLWVDANGNNPDFFIFENGGNDSGTIRAIFPDGSLGNTISFNNNSWGDTGYDSSFGQDIKGLTFAITDLLDASGNHLTNSTVIKGLQIASAGLDPSSISAVIVGEPQLPCVNTVSGLGSITATGNAGAIQTITYGGETYNTSDLLLGTTKLYNSSDAEVASTWPAPGADDFSFDQTVHTTDGLAYLETKFADMHDTFFVFENGGNDNANWYGINSDNSLTDPIYVNAFATAQDTGYKTGIGNNSPLKGFVFKTCTPVKGIRIVVQGFDAYSISAVELEEEIIPVPGGVCPHGGDWDKVDGLTGISYAYTADSGKLVAEACYEAGTSVIYENIDPATSPVTVNSTVWNKDGCSEVGVGGCNYQDLSHASFRLVDAPQTGSIEVTKVVDWGNSNPDTNQSFEICVTNESGTWSDCEDVDYDGGTVIWNDLELGQYDVTETDPGPDWVVSGGVPINVSVTAGNTSTATITNTYRCLQPLCEIPEIIGFDDLQTGEVVTNQYNYLGVTISAKNNNPSHPNKAIIFDSANPSGNDSDLVTPGFGPGNLFPQGKVLIIAQDDLDIMPPIGFVDDPNDESAGGILYFNFAVPAEVNGIGLLDIEENGGQIRLYDEIDNLIDTIFIPARGDNSYQTVNILKSNIKRMEVELVGSGAITHLNFCPLPQLGSITVCKVVSDSSGNIVDGSALPGANFSISGLDITTSEGGPASVIGTSSFITALTFNNDIFSHVEGDDAECVTYENLPLGNYYYGEETIPASGWETPKYNDQFQTPVTNLSTFFGYSGELFDGDNSNDDDRETDADGHIVLSANRPERTLVVLNQYKPVTIKAYKIVCDSETDLPNWSGSSNITESKINNFLSSYSESCHLEADWNFQYGFADKLGQEGVDKLNGTHIGLADGTSSVSQCSTPWCGPNTQTGSNYNEWKTFGVTDSNGLAEVKVNNLEGAPGIWVRESLKENYIPFSYPPDSSPGSNISAEIYCYNDVQNYDNFDEIVSPQYGQTYHCVAFNALNKGTIIVEKQTLPDGHQQSFNFSGAVSGSLTDGQQLTTEVVAGSHTVSETNYSTSGYRLVNIDCDDDNSNGDVQNGTATFNIEPGEVVKCTFTNEIFGSITAHKFEDDNQDGAQNGSEVNIGDWPISIYYGSDCLGDAYRQGLTNEQGDIEFYSIVPGNYSVGETLQPGWTNISPLCQNVTVDPGEPERVNFGNFELGKIQGRKFNDLNGNGQEDLGELPINDWTIRLYNSDWEQVSSDQLTHFIIGYGNGRYLFEGLDLGTYYICEVLQPGWTQSDPSDLEGSANQSLNNSMEGSRCRKAIIDESGDFIKGKIFGNVHYGSISGMKFEDMNGDGDKDTEDNGLEGWKIELKQGEITHEATTAPDGTYSFPDIIAGDYQVCEVEQGGWIRTQPSDSNCKSITVLAGEDTANVDFGNFENGQITACKYDDYNGDGDRDNVEPGIMGVAMSLEKMSEVWVESETGETGGDGCYTFEDLGPGEYRVREDLADSDLAGYFPTDSHTTDGDYRVSGAMMMTSNNIFTVDYFNDLSPISLSLDKDHNKVGSTVARGEILTFTLTVENTAKSTAYGVTVSDVLPHGFSYVSGTGKVDGNDSTPTTSGRQLIWNVGELLAGQEAVITYDVKVGDSQHRGKHANVAVARGTNRPGGSSDISTSFSNFDFVFTAVGFGVSYSVSVGTGFVLGAATGPVGQVLGAATGSPTYLLIMAIMMILAGLAILLKKGRKYHV
jgi:uncharacterized repeat protein (TIGR01451 family)